MFSLYEPFVVAMSVVLDLSIVMQAGFLGHNLPFVFSGLIQSVKPSAIAFIVSCCVESKKSTNNDCSPLHRFAGLYCTSFSFHLRFVRYISSTQLRPVWNLMRSSILLTSLKSAGWCSASVRWMPPLQPPVSGLCMFYVAFHSCYIYLFYVIFRHSCFPWWQRKRVLSDLVDFSSQFSGNMCTIFCFQRFHS